MPCCCGKKDKTKDLIEPKCTQDNTQLLNKELELSKLQDTPNDFGPGYIVDVQGSIEKNCSRFAVNFKLDKSSETEIALHINPRIAQHYVVRNSRLRNGWGEEETSSIVKFHSLNFKRDSNFQMQVFVSPENYFVIINDVYFCKYAHRVPATHVKEVEVCGKVNMDSITFRKVAFFPDKPFAIEPCPRGHGLEAVDDRELGMPITYSIDNFKIGNQLEIYGRVKVLPQQFYINLQEGNLVYPHPLIHFHFNPRFNTARGRLYLACNTWFAGKWGSEQRLQECEILPYANFSIAIRRDQDKFTIALDGKIIGEFRCRSEANKIDTVYVQGDVIVKKVYLSDCFSDKYHEKHKALVINSL